MSALLAERGINSWLRVELAKLDTRGMKEPAIMITSEPDNLFVGFRCYDLNNNFECSRGPNIAEAFKNVREKVAVARAEQLRAEAAKLLAEAAKLEAKP